MRAALTQSSDLFEQIGDLRASGDRFVQAIELTQLMGEPDWLAFLYAWHGRNLFLRGEWEGARERCQLAQQSAPPGVERFMAPYPPAVLGQILLAQGEIDEGRTLLQHSVQIAERNHDTQALCLALPALAEHALLEGRPEEVLSSLESTIETLRHSFFGDFCTSPLAMALARLGRIEQAEQLLSEAPHRQSDRTNRTALCGLLRAAGVVSAAKGLWYDAQASFRQAVQVAQEIGCPLAQGMALLDHGREATAYKDQQIAETTLQAALEIFDRLEAVPYANLTAKLLTEY